MNLLNLWYSYGFIFVTSFILSIWVFIYYSYPFRSSWSSCSFRARLWDIWLGLKWVSNRIFFIIFFSIIFKWSILSERYGKCVSVWEEGAVIFCNWGFWCFWVLILCLELYLSICSCSMIFYLWESKGKNYGASTSWVSLEPWWVLHFLYNDIIWYNMLGWQDYLQ